MTPGAHEVAVAVESERRRSGVGAVLVSSVLDAAAQHQLVGLELTVGAHRDWLVRFYECAGFRVFALSGRHVLMRAPLGAVGGTTSAERAFCSPVRGRVGAR
jgi:GNAT superfamily N-acetyltransferase